MHGELIENAEENRHTAKIHVLEMKMVSTIPLIE